MDSVGKECFLNGDELYQSIVGKSACDVHVLVGQLLIGLGFNNTPRPPAWKEPSVTR